MSKLTHHGLAVGAMLIVGSYAFAGCMAGSTDVDSNELHGSDETVSGGADALSGSLNVGATLKSTADVNLRTGASTADHILHVIPDGATVTVEASEPSHGFYKVKHSGTTGWAYGAYFKVVSSGSGSYGTCSVDGENGTCIATSACESGHHSTPGHCPGPDNIQCCTANEGGGGNSGTKTGAAITRAKEGKGFSYWWGHGRFSTSGPTASTKGTCSGDCPSCTHRGSYGGDCSGYAAKVWEVPSSNSNMSVEDHPYSTSNFVHDSSQWHTVSRSSLKEADALVYNSGSEGHIFIYEGGDGWGSIYAYECKGCSYGCVAGYRTASSIYHGIRREGY